MLTLTPFPWRRLTSQSAFEHRFSEEGDLLLRDSSNHAPFSSALVRDGQGGFRTQALASLGLVWRPATTGDGWALQSSGGPSTMLHTHRLWGALVRSASDSLRLDERIVLTTIACEATHSAPDAQGLVRAPRTEIGYPRRTGEKDPGDFERDAEDLRLSGGMHSSHGLMQTLIGTALRVRPDLFKGVPPSKYRTVLWSPAHSIACGAAYMATFPDEVKADPLAVRFYYGAGHVILSKNRWGAVLYDEFVVLRWLAFWNDGAELRRSEPSLVAWHPPVLGSPSPPQGAAPWMAVSVAPTDTSSLSLLLSTGMLLFGCILARGARP